jgi:hypothetical protein
MARHSNNYLAAPYRNLFEKRNNHEIITSKEIKSIHINQHMMRSAQCWFYFANELRKTLAN